MAIRKIGTRKFWLVTIGAMVLGAGSQWLFDFQYTKDITEPVFQKIERTQMSSKQKRIEELKEEARATAQQLTVATKKYNCGATIAEYIDPEIPALKKKLNSILEELCKIDSTCPKWRMT